MSCDCMFGTAYFWRDGVEGSDWMCSGTLTWLLRNGVVQAESPVFISDKLIRLDWDGQRLVMIESGSVDAV